MPNCKANPDLPNKPGEKLLFALARHHALTVDQAAILCFYTKNVPSYTYASRHLRRLCDHRYLRREEPSEKGLGDGYLLAARGKAWLSHYDVAIDEKVHHSPPKSLHLAHRLAVTSFLIQVERLQGVPLLEMRNEWQLSRTSVLLTLQDGKEVHYAPDAYFKLLLEDTDYPIALELDRGTEDPKVWRHKVRQMVAFTTVNALDGTTPFGTLFGVKRLRFAIVVAPGPKGTQPKELRARNLLEWTEQELKALGREKWAKFFYIRPIDALALQGTTRENRTPVWTPEQVVLDPAWCQPFSREYVPLIGGTA